MRIIILHPERFNGLAMPSTETKCLTFGLHWSDDRVCCKKVKQHDKWWVFI